MRQPATLALRFDGPDPGWAVAPNFAAMELLVQDV